jgi:ABC-type uncharacterized transport system permease subunit
MNTTNLIGWIISAVVYGTVLAISAMGETINEKAGHLNLGVPGIMYLAGFVSYYCVYQYASGIGLTPGLGQQILIAVIALASSFAVGALFGLIYSVMCVTFKANQNVMGLAIASFGVGFGVFLSWVAGKNGRIQVATDVFNSGIAGLKDLGVAGKLLFNYSFMTYLTLFVIILVTLFMNFTRPGLNLKAVGESPSTADSAGINIVKYKYLATLVGCGFCGVGGMAYVFTFSNASWSTNNNIESIGWLAVALVIFASWKPRHLIWGAPLFGLLFWAYNYLPSIFSFKAFTGFTEMMQVLPYLVTIIILIINSLRKKKDDQPPESLGLSYFREER